MARSSSKSRCAAATAGVSLGLEEPPAPKVKPQLVAVPGPVMAAPPPITCLHVESESKTPAEVRLPAVFTLSVEGVEWMVRGEVPGAEPFLLHGEERQDLTMAPWVTAASQALREITYRGFHGPVELRIGDPRAVGFLRVTVPARDSAHRWIPEGEEKPPTIQRLYREFLLLFHQIKPAILWVWPRTA